LNCIHYNKFIIIHLMNACIMYQNVLHTPISNTFYTASTHRAHDTLTTRPLRFRRPHSVRIARCANAMSRRCLCACSIKSPPHGFLGDGAALKHHVHSVVGDCTTRNLTICILGRSGNAVMTPLSCDRVVYPKVPENFNVIRCVMKQCTMGDPK